MNTPNIPVGPTPAAGQTPTAPRAMTPLDAMIRDNSRRRQESRFNVLAGQFADRQKVMQGPLGTALRGMVGGGRAESPQPQTSPGASTPRPAFGAAPFAPPASPFGDRSAPGDEADGFPRAASNRTSALLSALSQFV